MIYNKKHVVRMSIMEKLESRADVEVYVRNLVYSLVAPDSPVFEDFVEREIDFLTQVTSLDEKKIGSTYRARVSYGARMFCRPAVLSIRMSRRVEQSLINWVSLEPRRMPPHH